MINVSELSVSYQADDTQISALEDISVSIKKGITCAIIGPSGSGKSTFLRCIAGLQKDYRGSISLEGSPIDVHDVSIGFMPQRYGLLPWKTVRDNIELGCRLKHISFDEERMQIKNKLITQLGLSDKLDRYPIHLSGGEQQRVGLARIFLLRPDILLMDEPFSALDVISREAIQKVFLSLWKEVSVTTVFVTHFIEEAIYLGQQIIVFSAAPGKIVSVLNNPFFGHGEMYRSDSYIQFVSKLRQMLEKELNA